MAASSPPPRDAPVSSSAVVVVATAARLSPKHYLWVVGAVVAIAALLHWLGPILTPFLIGGTLAYVGKPVVSWMERKRVPRTVGALLVMLVALVLVLALLLVLAPLVHSEFSLLAKRLPELAAGLYAQVAPWLNEKFGIQLQFDLDSIKQLIADNLDSAQAVSLQVLTGLKAGGMMVVGILINLVLIPVVMFYLLRDWSRIVRRLDELTPRRWLAKVRTMAIEIDNVLGEFLRGQLSVMGVLAIYYAVGLTLAGLQFALPIGILTGLLVFIPYVGFGLGLILGMLAALLQWNGWPGFAAVLAVYGIGQLLEGYVLIPWLVGDRIGLHPLVVIFALLAFGQLFGFAGVLLALPVSAALLVGLRHLRAEYHESPLYR
jgi:predicted PurR-regulated permease PerM